MSWRQPRFLEDHLFCLENPVDSGKTFLTFLPRIQFRHDAKNLQLRIGPATLRPWENEFTCFRAEEFFTIAGCLFISFFGTVTQLFSRTRLLTKMNFASAIKSTNPSEVYLDGNALEVQATVSIMRASHYSMTANVPKFGFKGKLGTDFIGNVINELKRNSQYCKVEMPLSLKNFLEDLRIPFLYRINSPTLDLTTDRMARFSSYSDGFYTSPYTRTTRASQIDDKFQDFQLSSASDVKVVCECNNRSDKIDAHILNQILSRFVSNRAKLGLIVCREAGTKSDPSSKFALKCLKRNYHV